MPAGLEHFVDVKSALLYVSNVDTQQGPSLPESPDRKGVQCGRGGL